MPATISVTPVRTSEGWSCSVRVEDAGRVHDYTVHVAEGDVERLAHGQTVEDLVDRSFRFLLERESAESILREFRLMEIARYFPEYPRVIAG